MGSAPGQHTTIIKMVALAQYRHAADFHILRSFHGDMALSIGMAERTCLGHLLTPYFASPPASCRDSASFRRE
jgi:hypothetical protein